MPTWAAIVVGAAAVLTALTVIWAKAIRPGAKVISQGETIIPMMVKLTEEWKDAPSVFAVLKSIAAQFQNNSGSSLRDVVDEIKSAAEKAAAVAEELRLQAANQHTLDEARHNELRLQVEVQRELAVRDREQLAKLVQLVNTVDARLRVGVSGIADIGDKQHEVDLELQASKQRADLAPKDVPGAAADAALRSAERIKAEAIKAEWMQAEREAMESEGK